MKPTADEFTAWLRGEELRCSWTKDRIGFAIFIDLKNPCIVSTWKFGYSAKTRFYDQRTRTDRSLEAIYQLALIYDIEVRERDTEGA